MDRATWLIALALPLALQCATNRASDTPGRAAAPPKTVIRPWHRWTVKEIIHDFLVQVEFDAKRSKAEKNEKAAEVFEKLETDLKVFDRDLDDPTLQLQWADKRFDKYRDRLDQLAKRVEESRFPCVPFSMMLPRPAPADLDQLREETMREHEKLKRMSEESERLLRELERLQKDLERWRQEREKQSEQPKK
jgi:hypothetical protein